MALYARFIDTVVRVSSTRAAEMTKLLENIFRSRQHRARERARSAVATAWASTSGRSSTRPRRSRSASCRSSPGPGLGGHCIPIDPFYLSWKAREYDFSHRVHRARRQDQRDDAVLLSSQRLAGAEPRTASRSPGSRILVLGVAYKADIDDMRESPAMKIIELLQNAGRERRLPRPARPVVRGRRRRARVRAARALRSTTCVVIVTAHSGDRLRAARRRRRPRRRPPQRDRPRRHLEREGLEAVTRVAARGRRRLGQGTSHATSTSSPSSPGSATSTSGRRDEYARRYPEARVDRVVRRGARRRLRRGGRRSRRPCRRTHALAKQALEAGKHVFVEKPPAMRGRGDGGARRARGGARASC